MIKVNAGIESVPVYVAGKSIEEMQEQYGITEMIKLASNENPYGYSEQVKHALATYVNDIYYYPHSSADRLRAALAAHYGLAEDQVLVGAGLEEVIQMISATVLEPGTNAVMSATTFPIYKRQALIMGAEVIEVPSQAGHHDLAGMRAAITANTRVVWVCNPNNPTGTYITEQDLRAFLDAIPRDILVVLDEAYYEYATASDYPQSLTFLAQYPNAIVLRTFSKAYGLAGLRIGYAIAHATVIAKINTVRPTFNTSSLAQMAAIAALSDQPFVRHAVQMNTAELERFYTRLDQLHIPYTRSQTNFIYMDVGYAGALVAEAFLPHGVIIRPMAGNHIRVSIGTPVQNDRFFAVLKDVLEQLGAERK